MKYFKLFYFLLTLVVAALWSGCSENEGEEESLQPVSVTAQDLNGTFLITSFIDEGAEIVNEFGNNTEIEISSNKGLFFPNTSFYGLWDFGDDNSEIVIEISVGDPPFDNFENEWVIVKYENDELWLYDNDYFADEDSNGNEDLEQIKLRKVE
jgi:hypothetical protein